MATGKPAWLTRWLAIEIAMVVVLVAFFTVVTLRWPKSGSLLVLLAALATVAFGTRDWIVIRLSDWYGETTWVRYSSVFFGVALLLILLQRFRAASAGADNRRSCQPCSTSPR